MWATCAALARNSVIGHGIRRSTTVSLDRGEDALDLALHLRLREAVAVAELDERPRLDEHRRAARARAVIIDIERGLGFDPIDRELEKLGYDIESRIPGSGKLRFIEVKGRVTGADTVTVTKNEILYSLNKPDDFILAMVEFLDDTQHRVRYLRRPFERSGITTDFNGASVDFPFAELLARAQDPT